MRLAVATVVFAFVCRTAAAAEYVGYVVDAGDARVIRGGHTASLIHSKTLYAGDSLLSARGGVVFAYCPDNSEVTLAPNSSVSLGARRLEFAKGMPAGRESIESCSAPEPRLEAQSNVHPSLIQYRAVRVSRDAPATPEPISPALTAELDRIKTLDMRGRINRAVLYEQYGQPTLAIEEYRKIQAEWKDVDWIGDRIDSLVATQTVKRPAPTAQPKTYALVVGISSYQLVGKLNFAHTDAAQFAKYLKTQRGGAVPEENILLLLNVQATTSAIRYAISTFLGNKADKDDTVILFFAAHGMRKTSGGQDAFILTYDSDPQDPDRTALSMADLQQAIGRELGNVKRVLLYLDTCHAGSMGPGRTGQINDGLAALAQPKVFGMLASRAKEKSSEGRQYGAGHGAFTYYLMKGLNGAAGSEGGSVEFERALTYLQDQVPRVTKPRQHPIVFGTPDKNLPLADMRLDGINPDEAITVLESGGHAIFRGLLGSSLASRSPEIDRFQRSIEDNRIRRTDQDNAFSAIEALRAKLPPEQVFLFETELRVALEDEGQKLLLQYLSGDQTPQKAEAFLDCAAFFRDARWFVTDSPFLEAREKFCEGRALLFDKKRYDEAFQLLQESIRLDASGAYAYNAQGIGYLEHGDFPRAAQAFLDAIALAPFWTYPRHNLALALAEDGDYNGAIRAYHDAIELAPKHSYLHYNLGLLYNRLNRRGEAERSFQKAIDAAVESRDDYNAGLAYNAMGSALALRNPSKAKENLDKAIELQPRLLPARHNLALLLARKDPGQAIDLWSKILLEDADFLPSRISLAETLARQGKTAEAIEQYQKILESKPDYAGARNALDKLQHGR